MQRLLEVAKRIHTTLKSPKAEVPEALRLVLARPMHTGSTTWGVALLLAAYWIDRKEPHNREELAVAINGVNTAIPSLYPKLTKALGAAAQEIEDGLDAALTGPQGDVNRLIKEGLANSKRLVIEVIADWITREKDNILPLTRRWPYPDLIIEAKESPAPRQNQSGQTAPRRLESEPDLPPARNWDSGARLDRFDRADAPPRREVRTVVAFAPDASSVAQSWQDQGPALPPEDLARAHLVGLGWSQYDADRILSGPRADKASGLHLRRMLRTYLDKAESERKAVFEEFLRREQAFDTGEIALQTVVHEEIGDVRAAEPYEISAPEIPTLYEQLTVPERQRAIKWIRMFEAFQV